MSSREAANTSSSSSNSNSEIKDKLRVLCLHGYRQNGDLFSCKLGAFRKFTEKYAEFVFVTAPHMAAQYEGYSGPDPEQRSWWANNDDGSFKGTNKSGPAYGFQESLRLVEQTWKEQGPFQGLLGFSQGACFVGIICGLAKKHMTSIYPEFVVIASGFVSGSLVHKSFYEEKVKIPSLHIYGQSDAIIPKDMSLKLAKMFEPAEPVFLQHNGGHYLPATAQQKQIYINFFQDRLEYYLERLELQQGQSASFTEAVGEPSDESTKETTSEYPEDTYTTSSS